MNDDNKPSFVERTVRAGKLGATLLVAPFAGDMMTPEASAQTVAASAPATASAGAVIGGKIPNPTPEQRMFATNTTANFAVEVPADRKTVRLLIEANPAFTMPPTEATLTQFAGATNAIAQSLTSAGIKGVKVSVEPLEARLKANVGEALLEANPDGAVAIGGTLRRNPTGQTAFGSVGAGYKPGLYYDVTIASPNAAAAPDKLVQFVEAQYSALRGALGDLGAAPAAPAPAAPPPAADTYTIPDELTLEQKRLARNINGFLMQRNGNKVTLSIRPEDAIPESMSFLSAINNPTRLMNEWGNRFKALESLGFKNVQFDPDNRPFHEVDRVKSPINNGTTYGNIALSPADGKVELFAGTLVTVVPTAIFEIGGHPDSFKKAAEALTTLVGKMQDKTLRKQFDAQEKAAQLGR